MSQKRTGFVSNNKAFNATFQTERLSIGLVAPLDAYAVGAEPDMTRHADRIKLAEDLGFAAIWVRDIPFNVPVFGDVGQMFDPLVYLGFLAARTERIALGVGSLILPLRHPAHVSKAAASVDVLSNGRLLLGVASGDRPEEYPAMNMSFDDRGDRFRDSMAYIQALSGSFPRHEGPSGTLTGSVDMLPKPLAGKVPMLITGGSRQSPDWVAQNGDGWITYPRDAVSQGRLIQAYRTRLVDAGLPDKPVMQSLYVDILDDPSADPRPIHLGFQSGTKFLLSYLQEIQSLGVNHVALNLRFNTHEIEPTLQRIASDLLPHFSKRKTIQ